MMKNGMRPVHPGEVLLEEFMKPSDTPINANTLAKALEMPANRITAIMKGQRGIRGRYGGAVGDVVQHDRRILDESSVDLSGCGKTHFGLCGYRRYRGLRQG
ncbi:MAG: hypothetical protein U0236_08930 [Nitrospira sp.]